MESPSAHLPTRYGAFTIQVFTDDGGNEHIAMIKGKPVDGCLVRLHSECATGDILGSLRCDCRDQLETALQVIDQSGCGVLLYIQGHEGRGIGLANKIRAYALQENGADTVDANTHLGFAPDSRDYAAAARILKQLGLKKRRLLTNNRTKLKALDINGIDVIENVSLWTATNPHNEKYIATKRARMGHI